MRRRFDEIEANFRRREAEEQRVRDAERDHQDRVLEANLIWLEEVKERTSAALETVKELDLRFEERLESARVERVQLTLATWRASGVRMPIDARGDWTPPDYWVLRRTLKGEGGKEAYQESLHWKRTSAAQRAQVVFCERCEKVERLHAHHLHYETVGCERVRIDLMTLCRTCHLDKEHTRGRLLPAAANDPLPLAPGALDDIPF